MAKKKYRPINRSISTQNTAQPTSQSADAGPKKAGSQSYNAEDYIKRDVTGTLITAVIVVVVGVILYYIFR